VVRLIASELRHRRGRTLALLLGVVVATASFTLLTGAARSQRLEVRGTVNAHFRTAYDLLVRPRGARTALERSQRLVRRNFLTGVHGGISLRQLAEIRDVPGVQVAAPIAVIGTVMPTVDVPIDLSRDLVGGSRQLFRVRTTYVSDRGRTRIADAPEYVYVTRHRFVAYTTQKLTANTPAVREALGRHRLAPICPSDPQAQAAGAFSRLARQRLYCFSTRSKHGSDEPAARIPFAFPFVVAAVDPAAEARLTGIDRAVVGGRFLRAADRPVDLGTRAPTRVVPVIASTRPFADLESRVRVERLPAAAAQAVIRTRRTRALERLLAAQPDGPVVVRRRVGAQYAYRRELGILRGALALESYWTDGPVRYRRAGPAALAPVPVHNPGSVWASTLGLFNTGGFTDVPLTAAGQSFRALRRHTGDNRADHALPALRSVGTFDPLRIPGFLRPESAPLSTYAPPLATPADAAARHALGGASLLPDANPAGYLTAPPLLLTTMAALPVFRAPYFNAPYVDGQPQTNAAAPISVVRVRVAGVHGADAASRERIRLAAQQIVRRTGLDVDVTAGASPTAMRIDLPAGPAGRPPLALDEGWVKEGVAVAVLKAIDRKSLLLFCLVLVVCGLFCANAAAAAVRGRRTELGVLACVGWRPRRIFGLVIGELAVIGLAAGLLGAALALAAGALLDQSGLGLRAALAVPGATALAVLAGLGPARAAARSSPIEATRPAVRDVGVARPARSLAGLAWSNLRRVPGRTLLGATSLGVGVFALTILLAVVLAFRGAVVGSLLGDTVALQVRGADYAAVAAILVLGALGVADVLYLNVRDRAAELAAMRATGWRERHLARLVAAEGVGMGAAGALVGALLGLLAALAFSGTLPALLLVVTAAGALAGTVVAALAAVVPAALVRRLPTAELLAAD
jgi:putative ABC transport system permease protein